MKKIVEIWGVVALVGFLLLSCKETKSGETLSTNWDKELLMKYREVDSVHSVIAVQVGKRNEVLVRLLVKSHEGEKSVWTETLTCDALIGKNGLGKTKEGDMKTPVGDMGIITAFGIKSNPGTSLNYIDVNEWTRCCGDSIAYNRIIDIREHPHDCNNGEKMIDYSPHYNYGFFLDYNKECVLWKGSGIFFHCKGLKPYSAGCISVDEKNMITILRTIDRNTRVLVGYQ